MKHRQSRLLSKHRKQPHTLSQQRGFTLIELLVAIAIFALLSALGWQVLDHLMRIQQRNSQHEQVVEELQNAYLQIQRDSVQVVALSATISDQKQAAVYLNRQQLSMSKTGVTDPLKQGNPPQERVEYAYNADEKKLYRLKYRYLDRLQGDQPLSSVLLNDVDQYEVSILNPEQLNMWPAAFVHPNDTRGLKAIPKGIKFKFSIHDVEYEWIFNLNNNDVLSWSNSPSKQSSILQQQQEGITAAVETLV